MTFIEFIQSIVDEYIEEHGELNDDYTPLGEEGER